MPSDWSSFLSEHWIAGGLISSFVWFLAGKQTANGPRPENAVFWYAGGGLVIVAMCGWSVAEREWTGLVLGVVALSLEILWARRKQADKEASHDERK